VVGKSFARIFRRNCVNLGLPVLECRKASDAAEPGSQIRIDTDAGRIDVDGHVFQARPIPAFVLELQAAGGLVAWARERAAAE
jgi:3-isopropylmalate/(R)-2-methylmalate dehydratase small subunit